MKVTITIIIAIVILFLCTQPNKEESKPIFCFHSITECVDSYTEIDGCVLYTYKGLERKRCGNYTITKRTD